MLCIPIGVGSPKGPNIAGESRSGIHSHSALHHFLCHETQMRVGVNELLGERL